MRCAFGELKFNNTEAKTCISILQFPPVLEWYLASSLFAVTTLYCQAENQKL